VSLFWARRNGPEPSSHGWFHSFTGGTISTRPAAPRRWRRAPLGLVASGNRIPDEVRREIIELALDQPELSPRELAVRFTDEQRSFVLEASVHRLPKAHDLITSPAFIVIKAADEFRDKTTALARRTSRI
jgi:hypothetical protein